MTMMNVVNPRLDDFVGKMRDKLAIPKNQKKGDWRTCTVEELYEFLDNEMNELRKELKLYEPGAKDFKNIISECCDVANFAMMIADKVMQESQTQEGDRHE